jgi:hypothetical protein
MKLFLLFILLLFYFTMRMWPTTTTPEGANKVEMHEMVRWTQKGCPIAPKLPRNYFTQRKKKNKTKELKYDY